MTKSLFTKLYTVNLDLAPLGSMEDEDESTERVETKVGRLDTLILGDVSIVIWEGIAAIQIFPS